MNVAELLGLPDLESDLDRVDVALRAAVATEDVFLAEVGGHLVRAGGKRFRPALALAAGAVCGSGATDAVVLGGVACELMHLGSLYHDDVMDDADTRRGVPSANAKWGNLVAILAGDFLLGKASEIATDLGGEVSGVLARTLVRMCEGQVLELSTAFSVHRSEDQYLRSIAGKTAALMSAACRIGGLVGGATGEQADGLTAFGYAFGSTFQVYDDIADLVRTDEQLGKPAGHDMVEGVYTLPVLHALADGEVGPELHDLLGGPIDGATRDKALGLVRATDGVARAIATGRQLADKAAAFLEPLPLSPAREALATLGHRLLDEVEQP
jgi:heptaprenyl diphosphate synthase